MKKIFLSVGFAVVLVSSTMGQSLQLATQAYELRMNGKIDQAFVLLDSALAVYPDSAVLWFEKGRCYDWIKVEGTSKFIHAYTKLSPKIKKSRKCLYRAAGLNPSNARYHQWAAQSGALHFMVGIYSPWEWPVLPFRTRSMIRHARLSVQLEPDNPAYRYDCINLLKLGSFWGGSGKEARDETLKLEALDPVYGAMARREITTKKEHFDMAATLRALEPAYPDHPQLNRSLGRITRAHAEKSRDYTLRWIEADPLNVEAINQLYNLTPDSLKEDILPHLEAYLARAENSYTVYQSAGCELLGKYYDLKSDPERAGFYKRRSKELYPWSAMAAMGDWKPPFE